MEGQALDTVRPVSYTHLDVYKRQRWGCLDSLGVVLNSLFPGRNWKCSGGGGFTSVSVFGSGFACTCDTIGEFRSVLGGGKPVVGDCTGEMCNFINDFSISSILNESDFRLRSLIIEGKRRRASSASFCTSTGISVRFGQIGKFFIRLVKCSIPVSYTHLDVYKRQVISWIKSVLNPG